MSKQTVIVCYTGGVGKQIIRLLADHPTIVLAGVLTQDERKDGVDAGMIAGIQPLGVCATRKLEALLDLRADCALWHGKGWNAATVGRFLRAGTNVYSGIGGWYLHGQPEHAELAAACQAGSTTLAAGGNIPGLISDVLPLFVSGYSGRVTAIRAWQRSYNAHYPSAMQLSMGCGFGVPVDQQTMAAAVDASWLWGLGQSAKMVADGLGMPLDDFRILNKEYAPSPEDLELHPSGLKIPKGTPAGVRTAFAAYSGGRAFLQIVNEQTAHLGLGPGWRQTADEPNWRVEVDGSPNLRCDIAATAGNDGVDHAAALNAARSLNFVPRVVEARPGCLSVLDLPAPRTTGFRNA